MESNGTSSDFSRLNCKMMGIVYLVVVLLLSDREIIFDLLFAFAIMTLLLGLANENSVYLKGKAQSTEALTWAKTIQMDLISHRAETGYWPVKHDFDAGRYTLHDQIVKSITVDQGAIVFTFSERTGALGGRKLAIRPGERGDIVGAPVLWICGYAQAPQQYVVRGENVTDIPRGMLPGACRS